MTDESEPVTIPRRFWDWIWPDVSRPEPEEIAIEPERESCWDCLHGQTRLYGRLRCHRFPSTVVRGYDDWCGCYEPVSKGEPT